MVAVKPETAPEMEVTWLSLSRPPRRRPTLELSPPEALLDMKSRTEQQTRGSGVD